jgi:hypothetical protein
MTNTHLAQAKVVCASGQATPDQIDTSLKASLRSLPNLLVSYRKTSVVHPEYGFMRTRELPEIRLKSSTDIAELYRCVELACDPCPKEEIGKQLYAMSMSMAKRKSQEADFKMLLVIYAGDLAEYPRDVILDACREIRRGSKFFPTISELRDACDARFEFRRSLLTELAKQMSGARYLEAG